MNQYQQVCDKLKTVPKTWLVTVWQVLLARIF